MRSVAREEESLAALADVGELCDEEEEEEELALPLLVRSLVALLLSLLARTLPVRALESCARGRLPARPTLRRAAEEALFPLDWLLAVPDPAPRSPPRALLSLISCTDIRVELSSNLSGPSRYEYRIHTVVVCNSSTHSRTTRYPGTVRVPVPG